MKYVYLVWSGHIAPDYPELRRIFSTEKSAQEWIDNYMDSDEAENSWVAEVEIDRV